jgi:hypothetical protein
MSNECTGSDFERDYDHRIAVDGMSTCAISKRCTHRFATGRIRPACGPVDWFRLAPISRQGERPTGAVATAATVCLSIAARGGDPGIRAISCLIAAVTAHGDRCQTHYFVTNGGRAIRSTQLVSSFFALPLSRNSIAMRSIQPGSRRPSTP